MARDPVQIEGARPRATAWRRWRVIVVGLTVLSAILAGSLTNYGPIVEEGGKGPRSVRLPMRYTGEFHYENRSTRQVWSTEESVEITSEVLRLVTRMHPGTRALSEDESRRSWTRVPFRARVRALGTDWHYIGTRGVNARMHIYRQERTLAVRVPAGDEELAVANQVPLPTIHLDGGTELEPDQLSTMRFVGPRRLLNATSPNAKRERFGDEVAYTIALGDLVGAGRDVRVLVRDPTPPDKSLFERLHGWASTAAAQAFDWFTSLIGLILGAAITAVVGPLAVRAWNRRHGRVAIPDPGSPALATQGGDARTQDEGERPPQSRPQEARRSP